MQKTFIISLLLMILGLGTYWVSREMPKGASERIDAMLSGSAKLDQKISTDFPMTTIETNLGAIKVQFYEKDAPQTVANFTKLAQKGFYNGLTFHRVIPGFMIQGGDPNCGSKTDKGPCGAGGPGYKFNDEIKADSLLYKTGYKKGIVAMANSGPDTNGSQFFIMVADYPLPPNYTIFGHVVEGQDVADKISETKRDSGDRPLESVVIKSVKFELAL